VTVPALDGRQSNQQKHATREELSTTRQVENRWQGPGSPVGIDVGRARFVASPRDACSNACHTILLLRRTWRGESKP
jgi:hypothetical protein